MDVKFGTWNVMSLYRAGSFTAADRDLTRYKSDLVGVQVVRWDKRGTVREGVMILAMEEETKIINWKQEFLYTTE